MFYRDYEIIHILEHLYAQFNNRLGVYLVTVYTQFLRGDVLSP